MSLVDELEGSSLSDGRLTGEFLALDGGRLFETLPPFSPLNRNLRVSPFCFTETGCNVARISVRIQLRGPEVKPTSLLN